MLEPGGRGFLYVGRWVISEWDEAVERPSFCAKRPLPKASFHSSCMGAPFRIWDGSFTAMASGMPLSIKRRIMIFADLDERRKLSHSQKKEEERHFP